MNTTRIQMALVAMVVILILSTVSSALPQKKTRRAPAKKSTGSANTNRLVDGRNVDFWPKFEHTSRGTATEDFAVIYHFLWNYWKNEKNALIKLTYFSTDTGIVYYIFVEQLNERWVVSTTSVNYQMYLSDEITHYPPAYFLNGSCPPKAQAMACNYRRNAIMV